MFDRVPLYPGRVTLTPVEGQANTYDMVRADQPTQVGTALSKANLLKDLTAAQFGLDENAVPDDVLNWLGKYNEHWWSSIVPETYGYVETRTTVPKQSSISTTYTIWYENVSTSIKYSKNISIDQSSGVVSLKDPVSLSRPSASKQAYINAANELLALAPCYVTGVKNGVTERTEIFYIPADATLNTNNGAATIACDFDDNYVVFFQVTNAYDDDWVRVQTVSSSYTKIAEAGDTIYLHSTDRDAYPDSGIQDGITYTYLGVPFEKFPSAPQIETGSYVGTGYVGTYVSSEAAQKLSFEFTPKMVVVFKKERNNADTISITMEGLASDSAWFLAGGTTIPTCYFKSSSTQSLTTIEYSLSENTLIWWITTTNTTYTTLTAKNILNAAGVTYCYIALG